VTSPSLFVTVLEDEDDSFGFAPVPDLGMTHDPHQLFRAEERIGFSDVLPGDWVQPKSWIRPRFVLRVEDDAIYLADPDYSTPRAISRTEFKTRGPWQRYPELRTLWARHTG